jgi:hypothetical protein
MSKVTDPIHWGQLLNDHDEYQCPWSQLPYLTMYWRDDFWMTPGQISRRATDAAGRSHARAVHVKQQDVEAQLVAAGIFKCKLQILRSISRRTFTVSIQSQFRDCARSPNRSLISALTEWFCTGKRPLQYIIRTLETVPDPHDDIDAAGDGEAEFQLKLDLQIPAVANWIRHNGQRLYNDIGKLKEWHKRNIPAQARQFDQPKERWTFWQKRYVLRWAGKYSNRVGDRSFIHITIVMSE